MRVNVTETASCEVHSVNRQLEHFSMPHGVFGGNIAEPSRVPSDHGLKRKDVQLSLC